MTQSGLCGRADITASRSISQLARDTDLSRWPRPRDTIRAQPTRVPSRRPLNMFLDASSSQHSELVDRCLTYSKTAPTH
jgi:hypothetical protein